HGDAYCHVRRRGVETHLFRELGMGQGTLSFSKNTQTRLLTFDWRSEMNIKSLLLGSAVAAVAATGARAADAIVIAEPEPMEYVRICDTYGVGYFYIPGTETCMRIGGWVRYEIGTSDAIDGWSKLARGRLE